MSGFTSNLPTGAVMAFLQAKKSPALGEAYFLALF